MQFTIEVIAYKSFGEIYLESVYFEKNLLAELFC